MTGHEWALGGSGFEYRCSRQGVSRIDGLAPPAAWQVLIHHVQVETAHEPQLAVWGARIVDGPPLRFRLRPGLSTAVSHAAASIG